MKYKFINKTDFYSKKLSKPTGGMKNYFRHIKCYKNIVYAECEFYFIFIILLFYSASEIYKYNIASPWVFGLFASVLLVAFAYITVGSLLLSGKDNVIACIQVDFFHKTPHHIIKYFPLSISMLTFGGELSEDKVETLCSCLWIYHLANKNLTWHFFVFKSISNYLFLHLFILLFFIERSLSPDFNNTIIPYFLIFFSIIITAATAYKLLKNT